MTVTADNKKRVVLPNAKPGDCFQFEQSGNEIRLTLLVPAEKPKVRLVRKHGYLVGIAGRQVTQEEVRKALDEFP